MKTPEQVVQPQGEKWRVDYDFEQGFTIFTGDTEIPVGEGEISKLRAQAICDAHNASLVSSEQEQDTKADLVVETPPANLESQPRDTERLTRLKFRYSQDDHFPDDVKRMKLALRKSGYLANDDLISFAWRYWSEESRCAGWYSINGLGDEWIVDKLLSVLEPERGRPNTGISGN